MAKKVGELLKMRRNEMKLTVIQLSSRTDVNRSFIDILENCEYENLPAEIYVKSFLLRIAKVLDLDGQFIYAKYLRENKKLKKAKNKKDPHQFIDYITQKKQFSPTWFITPKHIGILVGIIVFVILLVYFYFQASILFTAPDLNIEEPINESEVIDPIIILKGNASVNSVVRVDGQEIEINEDGDFEYELKLINGLNIIKVTASNRLDKEVEKVVNVIYSGPEELLEQDEEINEDESKTNKEKLELELQVKVLSALANLYVKIDGEETIEKVLLRDGEQSFSAESKIELSIEDGDKVELIYNDQYLGEFPVKSQPNELTITFEKEQAVIEENENVETDANVEQDTSEIE